MSLRVAEAAFSLYVDYVAIKSHFSGQLVWQPGILSSRFTPDQLSKRQDWQMFVRVVEKRGTDPVDLRTAVVTLFTVNPTSWIGDMLGEDFARAHHARLQRLRRLDETFLSDIVMVSKTAQDNGKGFLDYLMTGDPPLIIKAFSRQGPGGVCLETLTLVNYATGFANAASHDPLWERRRGIVSRYTPFLAPYIDIEQVKDLVCNTVCAEQGSLQP